MTYRPTHEDLRYPLGSGNDGTFAEFFELTRDVTAGIISGLQIVYSSELAGEINLDREAEATSPSATINIAKKATIHRSI